MLPNHSLTKVVTLASALALIAFTPGITATTTHQPFNSLLELESTGNSDPCSQFETEYQCNTDDSCKWLSKSNVCQSRSPLLSVTTTHNDLETQQINPRNIFNKLQRSIARKEQIQGLVTMAEGLENEEQLLKTIKKNAKVIAQATQSTISSQPINSFNSYVVASEDDDSDEVVDQEQNYINVGASASTMRGSSGRGGQWASEDDDEDEEESSLGDIVEQRRKLSRYRHIQPNASLPTIFARQRLWDETDDYQLQSDLYVGVTRSTMGGSNNGRGSAIASEEDDNDEMVLYKKSNLNFSPLETLQSEPTNNNGFDPKATSSTMSSTPRPTTPYSPKILIQQFQTLEDDEEEEEEEEEQAVVSNLRYTKNNRPRIIQVGASKPTMNASPPRVVYI